MDETINSIPIQPKKNNGPLITVIAVVIVAVIIVGYLYIKQTNKTEDKKTAVIENVTPTLTPTDKPKVVKTSVRIQVINGTGTPGQAGDVVKALEEAGYSADKIKTENAENFDNAVSSIKARVDFEEIANDIKETLKPTFDDIAIDSNNLDEDSEFDIVVVTGGKIFASPTPTLSPTEIPTPTVQITVTPSPTTTPTLTPTPTQ